MYLGTSGEYISVNAFKCMGAGGWVEGGVVGRRSCVSDRVNGVEYPL